MSKHHHHHHPVPDGLDGALSGALGVLLWTSAGRDDTAVDAAAKKASDDVLASDDTAQPTVEEPTPATYESGSARILRDVTSHSTVVWSPERGWHDEEPSAPVDAGAEGV